MEKLNHNNLDKYIVNSKVNWYNLLKDYFIKFGFNIDEAPNIYKKCISEGIYIKDFKIIGKNNFKHWATDIQFFSRVLYSSFPEYFFPYTFKFKFNEFKKICNEFDIIIPEVPKKKDWYGRATYYLALCEAILEFRKVNAFKPAELCAFLYDFAPNIIRELEDTELPNPSRVWFVGGSKNDFKFLDNATDNSTDFWQGNIDSKKGDIIVMYCLTPRSYIHSIWRVVGDGFADPFFYYYNLVYISKPIKLDVQITKCELENNFLWSKNPLVRKNLQGINGYPIKYNEYLELLSILQSKGQNIDNIPSIKPTNRIDGDDLNSERDVEIKLIEPLLELLQYNFKDWIRQMPVKMGRGERNYPDYCFGANPTRGEESAKMILESKFEIKTQKELQEAYFQAKSYAIRLQAEKFVIAAREGIWVYSPKNMTYKFDNYFYCNWVDIENPEILYKLQHLIGKNPKT
ncbi:MAG: type I restriction endonuclease subunit R [Bacteroidales bacterium]|nr:type I restriction endonuclease subunit R [Bacteroidales bacterium]